MVSTLERWYTIVDKYLLGLVVLILSLCVVRAVRVSVSYLCIIFKICNVGNVCKFNAIIVRQ